MKNKHTKAKAQHLRTRRMSEEVPEIKNAYPRFCTTLYQIGCVCPRFPNTMLSARFSMHFLYFHLFCDKY